MRRPAPTSSSPISTNILLFILAFVICAIVSGCVPESDAQSLQFAQDLNAASWTSIVEKAAADEESEKHKSAKALLRIVEGAQKAGCDSCHNGAASVWLAPARLCFGRTCGLEGTLKSLAVYHVEFRNRINPNDFLTSLPSKAYFGEAGDDVDPVNVAFDFTNEAKRGANLRTGPVCTENFSKIWTPTDARPLRNALRTWMLNGAWLPDEAYQAASSEFLDATEQR